MLQRQRRVKFIEQELLRKSYPQRTRKEKIVDWAPESGPVARKEVFQWQEDATDAGPGGASPRRRDAMRTPSTATSRKRRKILSVPVTKENFSSTLDSAVGSARPSAGTNREKRSTDGRKQRDDGSRDDPEDSEKDDSNHQWNGREIEKREASAEVHFKIENQAKETTSQKNEFTGEISENKGLHKRGRNQFRSLALACVFLGILFGHWWPGRADAFAGGQKYSTRVVRTRYGTLRGIAARTSEVEIYYGVPYATPPLGSLRYMPPVTPTPWRGTKLADSIPAACPQKSPKSDPKLPSSRRLYLEKIAPILANQSEDCLYLNIYVPRPPHGKSISILKYTTCWK